MIGSAGSEEKCEYLKELGFDEVFNYKTTKNLDAKLKELAPEGIDVYFDNVRQPIDFFPTDQLKNPLK